MSEVERKRMLHDLDVTVWVGKGGVEAVVDELDDQLESADAVKVKFLRAARGSDETSDLADDLADRADAEVFEVRGHTALLYR